MSDAKDRMLRDSVQRLIRDHDELHAECIREREEDRAAIREMAWALRCLAEWKVDADPAGSGYGMKGFAQGSLQRNAERIARAQGTSHE
jgi:hypothetical protein